MKVISLSWWEDILITSLYKKISLLYVSLPLSILWVFFAKMFFSGMKCKCKFLLFCIPNLTPVLVNNLDSPNHWSIIITIMSCWAHSRPCCVEKCPENSHALKLLMPFPKMSTYFSRSRFTPKMSRLHGMVSKSKILKRT